MWQKSHALAKFYCTQFSSVNIPSQLPPTWIPIEASHEKVEDVLVSNIPLVALEDLPPLRCRDEKRCCNVRIKITYATFQLLVGESSIC